MFDYQTGYYEYNYRTLREAQEAKKQAGKGAKITTFLSTNENMEIITTFASETILQTLKNTLLWNLLSTSKIAKLVLSSPTKDY